MAEFVDVMRNWTRMCKSTPDCNDCRLRAVNGLCPVKQVTTDWAAVEKAVEAWAAEHPEPVYPTWYRWLTMMGAVTSSDDLWMDLQQIIPADIAEKIGVKPKEG